jgi:DNA-directed RNA polymerase specialized sigma24 family protein
MDARLLVDHIPSLRRYARALTGNTWAADDLVQDTLERACSKWRLWVVGSDLRAWLFTVMHNIFASQVRRTPPPHSVVPLDDATHELHGGVDPGRDQGTGLDLQRCLHAIARGAARRAAAGDARRPVLCRSGQGAGHSRRHRDVAPLARPRAAAGADGWRRRPHRPGLRRLK